MTRVLFATRAWESPEIEGGYLLLKDIARRLSADGVDEFEACFFAMRDDTEDGVRLLKVFRGTGWSAARRLEFFRGLLKHLRNVDAAHFAHTPTMLNSLLIRTLKRLYPSVTFVQTITGFDHGDRGPRSLYWGDVITTISARVQVFLQEKHGLSAELLTPHPDPGRFVDCSPLPDELAARFGSAPLIVFPVDVFRLDLEEFSFRTVCEGILAHRPDCQLVFLDRFGDETRIREQVSALPVSQMHFLPVIDYMPALIQRASVLVFPMTDIDGKFNPPMVLLEALQVAVPVVCSDNVDLPVAGNASPVAGWDGADWVDTILAALDPGRRATTAPANAEFERNCYRYLGHYRAGVPAIPENDAKPLTLERFIDGLDAWARQEAVPVFRRQQSFVDVDFSGCRDVDIWVRAVDSAALQSFLDAVPATRIIHRRAAHWTSHDVYIVRLAEGRIQLDVGVGQVSTGRVVYASLDDIDAGTGLVELPDDVEIFERSVKQAMRGKRLGDADHNELGRLFAGLDDDAQQRLCAFFGQAPGTLETCFAEPIKPRRLRALLDTVIRRSFYEAARHPLEFARVARAKLSLPSWPAPFGRRVRGPIVAIIGTDGAGKSTAQETLQASLSKDGYRPRYVYMGRARGNLVVSDRLREKAGVAYRRSGAGWLKYLASWVYLFDYLARFSRVLWLSRVRGQSILCDRYFYDIRLMDSYSKFAYRLLSILAPRPDVLAVLDCKVETLMRRKAERTPAEYQRQREFYIDVAAGAKVRLWRGILDTDSLDSDSVEEILSSLVYRGSHKGYDY